MYRTLRTVVVAALTTTIVSANSAAQTREDKPGRGWSVSWAAGGPFGRRSTVDIEKAMIAAGLDDPSTAWCFPGHCRSLVPHPQSSYAGRLDVMLTVGYLLRPRLELRALWAIANLGETEGYRYRDDPSFGTYMSLKQRVTSVAVLPALKVSGAVRVGAGPSLNFLSVRDDAGVGSTATRPGLLAEASLTMPTRSRFFFEASAQYRLILPAEVGPFEEPASTFGEGARLPRTRVSFSHGELGLGLGVRL